MSFDPRREDYLRLGLRFARTLDSKDPFGAARAISTFSRRYDQNRDALPQSDGDRAFHLVAEATDLIDYQLPFASDEAVQPLLDNAGKLLDEALDLDAHCHDATRMKAAAELLSFESYYRFLEANAPAVRESCLRRRDAAREEFGARADLAGDIALRPYLRWASTEAAKALICGRYTKTIELADELLELDPTDQCDVRFTAALAFAKLEDEAGLERLARGRNVRLASSTGPEHADAWLLMARVALAYKRRDLTCAREWLARITESYPHALETLSRQDELPDGVFARLAVAPHSEDELILAVSEATVLLQEGRDENGRGTLGAWVAAQTGVPADASARRA
ncbi:MAG: response regulator receiver protein [Atopobiaceae bacterium]|jgi:hypothetical protein|nr:response regulator receiver protein [Atopobiaceae bacterium]